MEVNFTEKDIKDLLIKVKIFNQSIGEYQLYASNESFNYFVKLTNGSIIFSIDDLIANQNQSLTPDILQKIAGKYTPSITSSILTQEEKSTHTSSEPKVEYIPNNKYTYKTEKQPKTFVRKLSIAIGALLLIGLYVQLTHPEWMPYYNDDYSSSGVRRNAGYKTSNNESNDVSNNESYQPREKTENELKQELYQKEKSNSGKYLNGQINNKINLAGLRVFEGNISNSATICGFKNIRMRITATAETGYKLENREYVITEFVSPQGTTSFKLKTDPWDNRTTNFIYTILNAENY